MAEGPERKKAKVLKLPATSTHHQKKPFETQQRNANMTQTQTHTVTTHKPNQQTKHNQTKTNQSTKQTNQSTKQTNQSTKQTKEKKKTKTEKPNRLWSFGHPKTAKPPPQAASPAPPGPSGPPIATSSISAVAGVDDWAWPPPHEEMKDDGDEAL